MSRKCTLWKRPNGHNRMPGGYKIFISISAIVFSLLAGSMGAGFVGGSDLVFQQRILCNFVFSMQFLATVWCVIAMFKK